LKASHHIDYEDTALLKIVSIIQRNRQLSVEKTVLDEVRAFRDIDNKIMGMRNQ